MIIMVRNTVIGTCPRLPVSLYILRLYRHPPLQAFFGHSLPHFSSTFLKIVKKGKPFSVWSGTARILGFFYSLFLLCFGLTLLATPLKLFYLLALFGCVRVWLRTGSDFRHHFKPFTVLISALVLLQVPCTSLCGSLRLELF